MIALLTQNSKKKVIVILNFRYAVNSWVVEFPGGCIDPNETIEEAGLRELKEETGYTAGKVIMKQSSFFVDPWKSNDVSLVEKLNSDCRGRFSFSGNHHSAEVGFGRANPVGYDDFC